LKEKSPDNDEPCSYEITVDTSAAATATAADSVRLAK